MVPHGDDDNYHPKDAIANGVKGAAIAGGAGLFFAAVQNSLAKQNVGAWSVFTRSGGIITTFSASANYLTCRPFKANLFVLLAAAGGAYVFSHNAAANLREKDDSWNAAISGALAGAIIGIRSKTDTRLSRG